VEDPRDSERLPRFDKLATHLMPLFKQLREESLRSFRFAIKPLPYIFNSGAYSKPTAGRWALASQSKYLAIEVT
jgi:hypothetical protein